MHLLMHNNVIKEVDYAKMLFGNSCLIMWMDIHMYSIPPSPHLLFSLSLSHIILVPPRILSQPHQSAFSNEQVTLTVTFQSHQESSTSVRWLKNNIHINSTNITTRYGPAPNATTELRFELITRNDRGSYLVEIENTAEAIPPEMRRAISSFNVDVHGEIILWYRSSSSVWSEKVVKYKCTGMLTILYMYSASIQTNWCNSRSHQWYPFPHQVDADQSDGRCGSRGAHTSPPGPP